jgi:hypothetical protein
MISSNIIALFFLIPFFILVGYVIYLLLDLTSKDKSTMNSSLSYIWDLYFNRDKLIAEISNDILAGISNIPSFNPDDFVNDAISSVLDRDAHTSALNTFCSNDPDLTMDINSQACVYATKEACEANSLKTQDVSTIIKGDGKYLTWQAEDSLGCVSSFGNADACVDINCPTKVRPCTQKEYNDKFTALKIKYEKYKADQKLGNDYQFSDYLLFNPITCADFVTDSPECFNPPYVPPIIKCEDDGYCYPKVDGDYGKCTIVEPYCASKGVSYSSTGLGTCYDTDVQGVAEALLGKTITRSYRKAYQNMVNACKNKAPHDQACNQALTTLQTMPIKILVDSVVSEYTQVAANIKSTCRINQPDPSTLPPDQRPPPMNGPRAMQCLQSVIELWPGFFVLDKLNGVINTLIRLIPGGKYFTGIDMFGIQSMLEFGGKALDAVFKFGSDAGRAFQEGGVNMAAAYDKMMAGGNLINFAVEEGAALAHVAGKVLEDCAKLGYSVIKAGVQTMHSVLLHGAQALEIIYNGIAQGINALGTYLADKMNTCGAGVSIEDCFDKNFGVLLGGIFGASAKTFLGAMKAFAWFAGTFAKMYAGIIDGIENFFNCFFITC